MSDPMKRHPRRQHNAPLFERLEVRSMMAADSSTLGLIAAPAGGDSVDACPSPAGWPVLPISFDPTTTTDTGDATTPPFAIDPIAFSPWLQYAAASTKGCLVIHLQADSLHGYRTDVAWFSLNPPPSPGSLPDFFNTDFTGVVFDGNDPTASPVPLDTFAPAKRGADALPVNEYVAIQSNSDLTLCFAMIGYTMIGLSNTPIPLPLPMATDGLSATDQVIEPMCYSLDSEASEDGSFSMTTDGLVATDQVTEPMCYSFDPQASEDGSFSMTTDGLVATDQVIEPMCYSLDSEASEDGSFSMTTDGLVAPDQVIEPGLYSFERQASEDGSFWMATDGLIATDQFIAPVQYSFVPQASDDTAALASAALVTSSPTAATTAVTVAPLAATPAAVNAEAPTAPTLPPPAAWAAYAAGRPSAVRRTSPAAGDLAEVDGRLPKDVFAAL
jgi:hypothetical protein